MNRVNETTSRINDDDDDDDDDDNNNIRI